MPRSAFSSPSVLEYIYALPYCKYCACVCVCLSMYVCGYFLPISFKISFPSLYSPFTSSVLYLSSLLPSSLLFLSPFSSLLSSHLFLPSAPLSSTLLYSLLSSLFSLLSSLFSLLSSLFFTPLYLSPPQQAQALLLVSL